MFSCVLLLILHFVIFLKFNLVLCSDPSVFLVLVFSFVISLPAVKWQYIKHILILLPGCFSNIYFVINQSNFLPCEQSYSE